VRNEANPRFWGQDAGSCVRHPEAGRTLSCSAPAKAGGIETEIAVSEAKGYLGHVRRAGGPMDLRFRIEGFGIREVTLEQILDIQLTLYEAMLQHELDKKR
jgi:hypothetical protein